MAGQWGLKSESVFGTSVVVDTFIPVLSSTLNIDEGYMEAKGIRGGRLTHNPSLVGARGVSGTVTMEFPNIAIAALLKHMFGAVTTTGAGPYSHSLVPATTFGKSFTSQTGIQDATATVQPFTASGCKVDKWELSCKVGELAMLAVDWIAKDVVTATGLATASYPATLAPFTFVQCTITVNGAAVASARELKLTAQKTLQGDRHVLGSRYIIEQLEQQKFDFTSEIAADFDSLTLFNLGPAATQVAEVIVLANGTQTLTITSNVQVTGDPPSLSGIGLEPQTIKLVHGSATSDAATITAVLAGSLEPSAA